MAEHQRPLFSLKLELELIQTQMALATRNSFSSGLAPLLELN
jgi:hypothetical protein